MKSLIPTGHDYIFEETFAKREGVTDEHVTTLSRAATTTATRSHYPQSESVGLAEVGPERRPPEWRRLPSREPGVRNY